MPNYKPILSGEALIDIERSRYNDLVATEERYALIVNYLERQKKDYINIKPLKELLGIDTGEATE
jgi:hypothetical protein